MYVSGNDNVQFDIIPMMIESAASRNKREADPSIIAYDSKNNHHSISRRSVSNTHEWSAPITSDNREVVDYTVHDGELIF